MLSGLQEWGKEEQAHWSHSGGEKENRYGDSVVFEEGCELFSSEEGMFEGRGTGEVITAVAEMTKLACS